MGQIELTETTSREALHIRGEQAYQVIPLALPAHNSGTEGLLRSAAAQLFVERARLQKPAHAGSQAFAGKRPRHSLPFRGGHGIADAGGRECQAPQGVHHGGQQRADPHQRLGVNDGLAQRPTRAQQLKKWLRRHRAIAWIMAALFVTALVGSIVAAVLIYQEQQRTLEAYQREADQRRRAETNLRIALEALDEIYLKVVEDNLPRDPQREPEYRELLQKALSFYEQFARINRSEPLVRLETGRAYFLPSFYAP